MRSSAITQKLCLSDELELEMVTGAAPGGRKYSQGCIPIMGAARAGNALSGNGCDLASRLFRGRVYKRSIGFKGVHGRYDLWVFIC